MKIGINTYFFKFPASGSGQYLLHLLQALAEVDQENEYILLGPHPMPRKTGTLIKFPHVVTSMPGLARRNASIENLMWEQFTAPSAARKAGVDLYHIPYFAPPFSLEHRALSRFMMLFHCAYHSIEPTPK